MGRERGMDRERDEEGEGWIARGMERERGTDSERDGGRETGRCLHVHGYIRGQWGPTA